MYPLNVLRIKVRDNGPEFNEKDENTLNIGP
jgi:hypothetical protein